MCLVSFLAHPPCFPETQSLLSACFLWVPTITWLSLAFTLAVSLHTGCTGFNLSLKGARNTVLPPYSSCGIGGPSPRWLNISLTQHESPSSSKYFCLKGDNVVIFYCALRAWKNRCCGFDFFMLEWWNVFYTISSSVFLRCIKILNIYRLAFCLWR